MLGDQVSQGQNSLAIAEALTTFVANTCGEASFSLMEVCWRLCLKHFTSHESRSSLPRAVFLPFLLTLSNPP